MRRPRAVRPEQQRPPCRETWQTPPPERLPGIFESFMTYANKQGTGLGLSFCKWVMTALRTPRSYT